MSFVRRYWAAALIIAIVALHAAIIGYVRSRVSGLQTVETNTIDMGRYRFQPVEDKSKVYQFHLHVVVDPVKMQRCKDRIAERMMEIHEESEILLRQVDLAWFSDPEQRQIRDRLMDIIRKHLEEPAIQRVLITHWLELPVSVALPNIAN